MLRFILRRLLQMIGVIVVLSLQLFIWLRSLPGGTVSAMLGDRATPESTARMRHELGHDEPDWRGDVEVKTVPVARDRSGAWRIAEDPAIAMLNDSGVAISKLQRTLWLVRADADDGDATILSWYLLETDAAVARLVRRYLHDRPKGPAGTSQRGLYLHKRFFADAGLLATLNGLPEAT